MENVLSILKPLKGRPEKGVLDDEEAYDTDRWQDKFVGPDAVQRDNDVRALLETYPDSLSRNQILGITNSDQATENRRILIGSLMWGYGTNGLRYPKRLVSIGELLADPGLDERLRRCRDHLTEGEVPKAYEVLIDIAGIKSAFFTKFLYFLGRRIDSDSEYPLILDTLVAKSLASLTGFSQLVDLDSYWPANTKTSATTYAAYVATMHDWARSLDTSADVIEHYLWHPPAQFHAACAEVHQPSG